MLVFKMHTERGWRGGGGGGEGVPFKFCYVQNFKTFVDGLHSVRMIEDQTQ